MSTACTAMILAAGRGERMRPLTDNNPKPLLKAGKQCLIEHQIERCHAAGHRHIVINTHYLGHKLHEALGDGRRYGVTIHWSDEHPEVLETGGGILKALPLLNNELFLVINGDVWCEHSLATPTVLPYDLAHLVLVNNPEHNPAGDFQLQEQRITNKGENKNTFSGIGWYRPALFTQQSPGRFALAPLLRTAMAEQRISGEFYSGDWRDIGTPERLQQLNHDLDRRD